MAQAVQIATHAYVSGKIVTRATAARSAEFFLLPARQGSFLVDLVVLVEQYPVIAGAAAPVFYDFIKAVFKKATGVFSGEPETAAIRKAIDKDEPFFDELAETLEGSLQRAHRPIGDGVTTISLERPRSDLIVFDQDSKDWVNTREENPGSSTITGNVTRFNSITRNGRVFSDQHGRIIPFRPDGDFPGASLRYVTWSHHGSTNSLPKKLNLVVREIKSAKGETKRLLLSDCERAEN
ncbi:hypothetical protein [Ostreiculturibacter nitratireducens]|uniref:DUF7946 domain-containing protein n=1 Tax=Ostreiculturibacter nitratireducens TaxID=3075226 RepID=UPI0031B61579